MDRREAQRLLGVDDDADLAALKRRFRILARDLHPDRGGDPAAFHDVRIAFALLRDELAPAEGAPRRPLVGRGRPSRTDGVPGGHRPTVASLGPDAHALGRRLDTDRTVRLSSRAPGSFLNRLAASLDTAATSSLRVTVAADDATGTPPAARIELTARSRAARRAVTGLDVMRLRAAEWSRRRGDAILLLHAAPRPRPEDELGIELLTAAAVVELLEALSWPLAQWADEPPVHGDVR